MNYQVCSFLSLILFSAMAQSADNNRLIIWTQFPLQCEKEIDFPSLRKELQKRFELESGGYAIKLFFPGEGLWFSVHATNATQREIRRKPGDTYLSGIDLVVESMSSGQVVARHHLGDFGEIRGRYGTDVGDTLTPRDGFIVAEDYWLDDIVPDFCDGELYRLRYQVVDQKKFDGIRLDPNEVYVIRRSPANNRERAISLVRGYWKFRERTRNRRDQILAYVHWINAGGHLDPEYLQRGEEVTRKALALDPGLECAWSRLVGAVRCQDDAEKYGRVLKEAMRKSRGPADYQKELEKLELAIRHGREWGCRRGFFDKGGNGGL